MAKNAYKNITTRYYISRSIKILGIRWAAWMIPIWACFMVVVFAWLIIAIRTGQWNSSGVIVGIGILLALVSILLEKDNRKAISFWLGLTPINVHSPGLPSTRPAKMLTVTRYLSYAVISVFVAIVTWFPGMLTQESNQSAIIDWLMHAVLAVLATVGFGELTIRKTRIPLVLAVVCFILLCVLLWNWANGEYNPVIAW